MFEFLLGGDVAKNNAANITREVGSGDEKFAISFARRGGTGDAGVSETLSELEVGFVHGEDAFFRRHDKAGNRLEVGAFVFFFLGEFLELLSREGTGDSGLLGIDTRPENGVGWGTANGDDAKNGRDDGRINSEMSHHVGLAEEPTFFGVAKNDFVRSDMTDELMVGLVERGLVDNLIGRMDGGFVFDKEKVGHLHETLTGGSHVFLGVNGELSGRRKLEKVLEFIDKAIGRISRAVDKNPLGRARRH